MISWIWSIAKTLASLGASYAKHADINPEPVPISRIFLETTNLSISWFSVYACISGEEIVVFHPIYWGWSLYGFSEYDASN